MTKHALGLPSGSVRAVLALLFAFATSAVCVYNNNLDVLAGLTGAAIGYYFSKQSKGEANEKTQ